MKIEIDLNDIIGDEDGSETLQDSVRRQVIDSVTSHIKSGIGKKIDDAVASTIQAQINVYLTTEMPNLLLNIMDAEYRPVSNYGSVGEKTSFREQLLKSITSNMEYKKAQYDSDKNAFTKAVDQVVAEHMKEFKLSFSKKVDAEFTQAAMNYATEKMKERLGVK